MSELRIETGRLVELNILLLFLVSIEPFLFNQLNSSSPLVENVSILYALDLGGLFIIQAFLANLILSDKTRPESLLQTYKLRRNTMIISAAFFFISVAPFFWTLGLRVNGAGIPLRIILWLIPMFLPSIRRIWERKLNNKSNR
jgi:uncharacterized membrane protein